MRKQWCAWDQSLDEFDKFWIDLNEATAMRPEAKAQIYSVNENLPANQVARMWDVLDQLERAHGKKRWRSRRQESKLRIVKFICLDVYQSFTMAGGIYLYPMLTQSYPITAKHDSYFSRQKHLLPNRGHLEPNLSINAETPNRHQIVTDPLLLHIIAVSQTDTSFLHYPFDACQKMTSTRVQYSE